MAAPKKETKLSVFETLSAINVNQHTDKKKNLTYLPWAWAWAEVKKAYPDANYKIGETEFDEALGFMCHSTVTIEGETLEMWLPVMDGANKSMKKIAYEYTTKYGKKTVLAATTFDINKTIMRCLTKNLAMFGLGLYIYSKEDLPDVEPEPVAPVALVMKKMSAKKRQFAIDAINSKDMERIDKVAKYLVGVEDSKEKEELEGLIMNVQPEPEPQHPSGPPAIQESQQSNEPPPPPDMGDFPEVDFSDINQ